VVRSSNQKPVVVGAKRQHPVFGCEGPEGDDLQPAVAGVFLVLRLGGDVANVDVGGFGFAGIDPIERVELVAAGNGLERLVCRSAKQRSTLVTPLLFPGTASPCFLRDAGLFDAVRR